VPPWQSEHVTPLPLVTERLCSMHLGPSSSSSNLPNPVFSSSSAPSWGRRGVGGEAAADGGRQRRCKIPRKSSEETCLATAGWCVDRVESVPWRRRCDLKGNPHRTMVSQSELKTYFSVPLGCGATHVLVHELQPFTFPKFRSA
jgi:hypothetical protein